MKFLCIECEFECEKQCDYSRHNQSKIHIFIKRKIEEEKNKIKQIEEEFQKKLEEANLEKEKERKNFKKKLRL